MRVSPTRMEFLKLKKRIALARRGHKLLKDKEEQLLIEFRKLTSMIKTKRREIEEQLIKFFTCVLFLKGTMERKVWGELIKGEKPFPSISVRVDKVFNIPVRKMVLSFPSKKPVLPPFTHPYFSFLLEYGSQILQDLIELANREYQLYAFAEEIERTRRRVNALEYVLIPDLERTIEFIDFKLSETERANLVRLKHLQILK